MGLGEACHSQRCPTPTAPRSARSPPEKPGSTLLFWLKRNVAQMHALCVYARMRARPNEIVVFDGLCNFCNGWVRFIARRDAQSEFFFATAQSATGAALLTKAGWPSDSLQTIILASGEQYYAKSEAVIEILRRLGGVWRLAVAARILPRRLRDAVYDLVARNRYRIAGKRGVCDLPSPDVRKRFLD